MSNAPFQPPSTMVEIPEQLRRLWRNLNDVAAISPLASTATLPETVAKVNEMLGRVRAVTKG